MCTNGDQRVSSLNGGAVGDKHEVSCVREFNPLTELSENEDSSVNIVATEDAITIQNGDISCKIEQENTGTINNYVFTNVTERVKDAICESDELHSFVSSEIEGINEPATSEWFKPVDVLCIPHNSAAITVLQNSDTALSSVIHMNDIVLNNVVGNVIEHKPDSFKCKSSSDSSDIYFELEKQTTCHNTQSVIDSHSNVELTSPGTIFSDDIMQLSKLNSKSSLTQMQGFDEIDSLELENLETTLDICSTSQVQGRTEEICIVVSNSDRVMRLVPAKDSLDTVDKHEEIVEKNIDTKSNKRQMRTKTRNDHPTKTKAMTIGQSEDVNTDWDQCLNDINLQIVESSTSGILQPIHDSSGVVVEYYYIKANGDVEKVENSTKDVPQKATDTSDGRLQCKVPGCGKTYKKYTKLRLHQMTHSGERPFKCMLPYCQWAFTTFYKLKRHIESHEGRKDFQCYVPECGRKFTTLYNLKFHQKSHEKPLPEECTVKDCGKRFASKRILYQHLKSHKDAEKPYKCPVDGCNKMFYSHHCMGSHQRVHKYTPSQLTCHYPDCERVFTKLSVLQLHQRTHTGDRPYACLVQGCDWTFPTSSKLSRHMARHTSERQFACTFDGCQKTFKRKEHLKGHVDSHYAQYACTYPGCTDTFNGAASLKRHVARHTTPNIYHCPLDDCDKLFATKGAVRQHLNKCHRCDTILGMTPPPVTPLSQGSLPGHHTSESSSTSTNSSDAHLLSQDTMIATTSQPYSIQDQTSDSVGVSRDVSSDRRHSVELVSIPPNTQLGEVSADGETLHLHSLTDQQQFILPSHGITFRDPETGLIYLQTQLLQDDPPNSELFPSDTQLQSATTINLHDLQ